MKKTILSIDKFGPIYPQFKNKPKEAILHLKKVKNGECINALFREDVGYVDIPWGNHSNETNNGYGLKHIIAKHGKEIRDAGFTVEDFIPYAFKLGRVKQLKHSCKILIENDLYRVALLTKWDGQNKNLLLTAFILKRKKPKGKNSLASCRNTQNFIW